MAQLVLLVLAAVWLAVLIPPLLRSRVENRPNSSVTDFRRQLTKLQNTATPPRGAVRTMGRPLAQSPLGRPAAAGRPAQPTLRSGLTRHPSASELAAARSSVATAVAHGRHLDPSAEAARPRGPRTSIEQRRARSHDATVRTPRAHPGAARIGDPTPAGRRTHSELRRSSSPADPRSVVRRRRTNVLLALVLSAGCTLFLAATTASAAMTYTFIGVFSGLCVYVYLLAQANQRSGAAAGADWVTSHR
ncbi:hypothetical protein [Ilumatobacter sp.]|uniref:hypothetical protein n=1 Tax=Ilumatobacter sp. TaxID=1967498 RepID=UPI003B519663